MAGAQTQAGQPSAFSFTAAVIAGLQPAAHSATITFPNGGTGIVIKTVVSLTGVPTSTPTVGTAMRAWAIASLPPGASIPISFVAPILAVAGVANLSIAQGESNATKPTISNSTLPFA